MPKGIMGCLKSLTVKNIIKRMRHHGFGKFIYLTYWNLLISWKPIFYLRFLHTLLSFPETAVKYLMLATITTIFHFNSLLFNLLLPTEGSVGQVMMGSNTLSCFMPMKVPRLWASFSFAWSLTWHHQMKVWSRL